MNEIIVGSIGVVIVVAFVAFGIFIVRLSDHDFGNQLICPSIPPKPEYNLLEFAQNREEEKYVSCKTCKHLLKKEDAQIVTKNDPIGLVMRYELYYCPEHKKPYDKIVHDFYGQLYLKDMGLVKVTEDGREIKPTKSTNSTKSK